MSYVKNRQIIDSHCHLQFPEYDADRDAVIRRALEKGIGMVCVGTSIASSRQAIGLAERYEGLYASVGIHPNEDEDAIAELEKLAKHSKVVAIGEIGLDYYRTHDADAQQKKFIEQLELARGLKKPAIIHCRDAHDDMQKILREHSGQGVIHSFNGTAEQAKAYMDLGYFIGLNAIITFSHQYDTMVQMIPLERMLLETDAPYLAPAPHRGQRNEPLYIEGVGNWVAARTGQEPVAIFDATTQNAKALFGI